MCVSLWTGWAEVISSLCANYLLEAIANLKAQRKLSLLWVQKCPLLTLSVALTWFLLLWNPLDPAATKLPSHFGQENLDYFCLCNPCPQCDPCPHFPRLSSSSAPFPAGTYPMGTSVSFSLFEQVGTDFLCFTFQRCDWHLKMQTLSPLFSHLWVGDWVIRSQKEHRGLMENIIIMVGTGNNICNLLLIWFSFLICVFQYCIPSFISSVGKFLILWNPWKTRFLCLHAGDYSAHIHIPLWILWRQTLFFYKGRS